MKKSIKIKALAVLLVIWRIILVLAVVFLAVTFIGSIILKIYTQIKCHPMQIPTTAYSVLIEEAPETLLPPQDEDFAKISDWICATERYERYGRWDTDGE